MKVHYYPGCTLKEKAVNLEETTVKAMKILGVDLKEPEGWTCCGAEFPLSEERISGLAAPARILRQVESEGGDKVTTTCAFCYNVLKRTNYALLNDPLKHKRINAFLKDDIKIDHRTKDKSTGFDPYHGDVSVVHLLEFLRDEVGFSKIKAKIKRDLSGLKVAAYYGCRLLRPYSEVLMDKPDDPSIFEDFVESLGAQVVDFPFRQECCGSYISVSEPDAAAEASYRILRSAILGGADIMVLSCPLCYYNLDRRQGLIKDKFLEFSGFPVLYFTQLLAWALGEKISSLGFNDHYFNPRTVLEKVVKSEVAQ